MSRDVCEPGRRVSTLSIHWQALGKGREARCGGGRGEATFHKSPGPLRRHCLYSEEQLHRHRQPQQQHHRAPQRHPLLSTTHAQSSSANSPWTNGKDRRPRGRGTGESVVATVGENALEFVAPGLVPVWNPYTTEMWTAGRGVLTERPRGTVSGRGKATIWSTCGYYCSSSPTVFSWPWCKPSRNASRSVSTWSKRHFPYTSQRKHAQPVFSLHNPHRPFIHRKGRKGLRLFELEQILIKAYHFWI